MGKAWIRIEVPGIVHWQFMNKVYEDFGTYHAQWKCIELLLSYMVEHRLQIKEYLQTKGGYRVISNHIDKTIKDAAMNYIEWRFGCKRKFKEAFVNLLKMYIYGEIRII